MNTMLMEMNKQIRVKPNLTRELVLRVDPLRLYVVDTSHMWLFLNKVKFPFLSYSSPQFKFLAVKDAEIDHFHGNKFYWTAPCSARLDLEHNQDIIINTYRLKNKGQINVLALLIHLKIPFVWKKFTCF